MVFVDADNKILATGFDPAETFGAPALSAVTSTAALACADEHPRRSPAASAPEPGWTTPPTSSSSGPASPA